MCSHLIAGETTTQGKLICSIVRLGEVYPTNTHCLITLSEACMLTLEVGVMGGWGRSVHCGRAWGWTFGFCNR